MKKPDDLALAAMAALAHWHKHSRNMQRAEPAYLNQIRKALEARGFMPWQLAKAGLDFEQLLAEG